MNIKRKYTKWLYKKYGNNVGSLFENVPLILRTKWLFSPSLYYSYLCQDINKEIMKEISNI